MKVHYLPYAEDESEYGACGTLIPEDGHLTEWWHRVTCKKCLNNRAKIEQVFAMQEKDIVDQMGAMAEFHKSNNHG